MTGYRALDEKRAVSGAVEAFDVIRFAGFLCSGFMLGWRNHALVGFVLIRMERGLLTVYQRDLGPQLFGALTIPVAYVKPDDLACLGIHSHPQPLLVRFLSYKAS
jgi:hypothetical protein